MSRVVGVSEFPGLGFDPAPGDPGALSAAAAAAKSAAGVFGSGATTLSSADSSMWSGEAADGFHSQLARLPKDLAAARDAHATAASALSDYAGELTGQQARAASLEEQAVALRARQQAAVAAVNALAGQSAPTGSADLAALQERYRSARSAADQVGGDLDAVLSAARSLRGAHRAASGRGGAGDEADPGAAAAPYQEPNWFSRQWDKAKSWISDHADTLKSISNALKIVSGVLGVLSLVPGLQWLAPIALAAAGIAIGIDIAVKLATGEGSWTSIWIDVALTFLPAGRILGAGGRLVRALRGADDIARVQLSSYRAGHLYGASWASTLDQRVKVDADGVCFPAADGTVGVYPPAAEGGASGRCAVPPPVSKPTGTTRRQARPPRCTRPG